MSERLGPEDRAKFAEAAVEAWLQALPDGPGSGAREKMSQRPLGEILPHVVADLCHLVELKTTETPEYVTSRGMVYYRLDCGIAAERAEGEEV